MSIHYHCRLNCSTLTQISSICELVQDASSSFSSSSSMFANNNANLQGMKFYVCVMCVVSLKRV